MSEAGDGQKGHVERHFDETSGIWQRLYDEQTVLGRIFRERQARAVEWAVVAVGGAGRALDVGCGAGGLAVELARRGFAVEAMDSSEAMVANARAAVEQHGVADSVVVSRGDVHDLSYEDEAFDVVVALGVLPWVRSPVEAMREMARVLRPGGHLIFTCDNAFALQLLLDPRLLPLLDPLKRALRARVRRRWPRPERPRAFRARTIGRLVADARLEPVDHSTIQFGPFSFLGLPLTSDAMASRLHEFLQRQADARRPVVRGAGRQHMVLARRTQELPVTDVQ
jgi:2-polyprenyl-3-methyl-5-hydroxy-6-metoxy-1,4-benzoquinol methylase